MFLLLCLLTLSVFVYTEEITPSVILAITQQNSKESDVLLDTVFPSFLHNKSMRSYYVDVIPSGDMRWDEDSSTFICGAGKDQCDKQILQYCAIREYSFEIVHEFVRCVQTFPSSVDYVYRTCKRFALLQYSEIDKCMKDKEAIGKELIALGKKHRNNQSNLATQLFFNDQLISLEKLESDPQAVFSRLQYRVCSSHEAASSIHPICRDDYNILTESIRIHQEEQDHRATLAAARYPKYSREFFTMKTLRSYSDFIQHRFVQVDVLYDPLAPTVLSRLDTLHPLVNPPFSQFTSVQLIPVGAADLSGCAADSCLLQKAMLCSTLSQDSKVVLGLQSCILQSSLSSVERRVRQCGRQWGVFPLSILKCMEVPWVEEMARNITVAAYQAVHEISEAHVITDLASSELDLSEAELGEDELEDEIEVEVESEDALLVKESKRVVGEFMPWTVMVNGNVMKEGESLKSLVCANVKGSKPLVCQGSRGHPQYPAAKRDATLEIFVNVYCTTNEVVMAPLMQWLTSDPEIEKKVAVRLNPFIDILIDRNERGIFELRTPNDYKHLVVSMAMACAVRFNSNPVIYWPFVQCLMKSGADAVYDVTECADATGYDVYNLGVCLRDERFMIQLWEERKEELRLKRWYSVSPYMLLNGKRVTRLEEVPERICKALNKTDGFCSQLPILPGLVPRCFTKNV